MSSLKSLYRRFKMFLLCALRFNLERVGKNFYVGGGVKIYGSEVEIGDNVFIGHSSHIGVRKTVIGNNVLLAPHVSIVGDDHRFDTVGVTIFSTGLHANSALPIEQRSVVIEDDCWLGFGVIVLPGVKIAEGCVIGAGSVLTKSTEPYGIYIGSPAKLYKKRFDTEEDRIKHSQFLKELRNK